MFDFYACGDAVVIGVEGVAAPLHVVNAGEVPEFLPGQGTRI